MDREEQDAIPAHKEFEIPQGKLATSATLIKLTKKVIAADIYWALCDVILCAEGLRCTNSFILDHNPAKQGLLFPILHISNLRQRNLGQGHTEGKWWQKDVYMRG